MNLTLDRETFDKLSRHAKACKAPPSTVARTLLREALERREELARRKKLAEDYSSGRNDARELLAGLQVPQLELLGDEED
ncbi:MAG TPA: hypothetical protein VGK67_09415 [Myxococcales bacterium]